METTTEERKRPRATAQRIERDEERAREINNLRELLPPGATVYTILRHVSKSGMYRVIDVYAMTNYKGAPTPLRISWAAAQVTSGRYDTRHEGVGVGGCGMDMGFAIAYDLAYSLYPKGYGCIGEGCPSNDHSNGDRDFTPHGHRRPAHVPNDPNALKHWHSEGGYSLKHRWM